MDIAEIHLLRPGWLVVLPLGVLLTWLLRRALERRERWRDACDAELLPHLLRGSHGRRGPLPYLLLVCGWALAALALAGPAWERVEQPVYRGSHGLVAVLDLSRSMDAADVRPSRLARARFKVADILRAAGESQLGLVVFAGDAFVVSPLTDDANTLLNLLPALETGVVPVQGGRAETGLERAAELLEQAGVRDGEVVLVADGANLEALSAAAEVAARGFPVSVLAVGSADGAPIPLADGGFLKDDEGQIVLAALDTALLREVARAGGGHYVELAPDDTDVRALVAGAGGAPSLRGARETEHASKRWRDQGAWMVVLLLPLGALAFRRGWLLTLVVVPAFVPVPVQALQWSELWLRDDQRAARAVERGDLADAAAVTETAPRWGGVAHYLDGEYPAAETAFGALDDAAAHYNRGNALARQGKLAEALAAYDSALAQDPAMDDALHNRELVARLLEQQQGSPQSGASERPQSDQGSPPSEGGAGENGDRPDSGDQQPSPGDRSGAESSGAQAAADGDARSGSSDGDDTAADDPDAGTAPDDPPASRHSDGHGDDEGEGEGQQVAAAEGSEQTEQQQAIDQWLRRIPDDPGGLLRRKFEREYRRRGAGGALGGPTW